MNNQGNGDVVPCRLEALLIAARNCEAWINDYVMDSTAGRNLELRELQAALAQFPEADPDGVKPVTDWFCHDCGSNNIVHDGELQWNAALGQMEPVGTFRNALCVDCMQREGDGYSTGRPVFGVAPRELARRDAA